MALPYKEATVNDTQDILTIFNYVNVVSDGYFFTVVLGMIWVIFFFLGVTKGTGASRAWTFAGFTCSVLAIILGLLGFINTVFIYFFVILTGAGLLWMRLENAPS